MCTRFRQLLYTLFLPLLFFCSHFTMLKILRMASKLSPIYCSGFNKGKYQKPFLILFLGFNTSRNGPSISRKCKYGFEDIKNVDDAVTLFHQMLEMKPMPSIHDFNKLLKIVMRMKQYEQVVVMWKELNFVGCPQNEFMLSIVVNCYCHLMEVGFGFAILGSSMKRGYAFDIVSINCLIKGLFLIKNIDGALELFAKLDDLDLCEATSYTISTVTNGLCKSGNAVFAVNLVDQLEKRGFEINVVVYTTLIDGLCKDGRVKDGRYLLERMRDRGILPDVVTYTSFIHGLCKYKELRYASKIFNGLPLEMISPNVIMYTVMIQGLCREGRFQAARQLLEEMERVGCIPDSVTYNIITQFCLRDRHSGSSINLLQQIVRRDFQLNAGTLFLLLGQIQGISGGSKTNLIRKLMYSDTKHHIGGINDDVVIKSLVQKLIDTKDQIGCISDDVNVRSFIQRLQ